MTLSARNATREDLHDIASWIRSPRECELWAGWRVAFPVDIPALPSALQFDDAISIVLTDAPGRIVAFGQIVRKDGGRGHFARLIVDPRQRRNGFGEALARELLARATRESFVRVSLNVDAANGAAIALYVKLGFRDALRPPDEPHAPATRYLERRA